MGLFQGDLVSGFGFTDDQVVDSAMICASELKRAGLDLPPPPPDASEYPTRPFGLYVPPSVEQQIGRPILETPSELLRGRKPALHRDSRLSISIPPDGGPVIVESLDIPVVRSVTSSPPLPSVVSVDDDKTSPGSFDKPEIPYQETASSQTARDRRAAFAKTHSTKQLPNGIPENTSSFPTSPSSNGKNIGSPGAGQTVTFTRLKSAGARKRKDREYDEASDSAAPQTYGVSVRL